MDARIPPLVLNSPSVLVVAGHDPSGAGIQADIETIGALGCRAFTLVTCLTSQNSRGVRSVTPTPKAMLFSQAECLLSDMNAPGACKIGLIPDEECLEAVVDILGLLPADIPVILDPVLGATAGGPLAASSLPHSLLKHLIPRATLVTPNLRELRRLVDAAGAPRETRSLSCEWCLVKGADEPGETITHRLFHQTALFAEYHWPRIDGVFHGSGCTLASAISAFIARGEPVATAVAHGLAYTWRALSVAIAPGGVQLLPSRPVE